MDTGQTEITNLGQVIPSLLLVEKSKLFGTVNSILKTESKYMARTRLSKRWIQ